LHFLQVRGLTGRQSGAAAVRSGLPAEKRTDSWWAAKRAALLLAAEGHQRKRPLDMRL